MNKGKKKCERLKIIRKYVAKANGIEYEPTECDFEGECPGTCPKCEAELAELQRQLYEKEKRGEKVIYENEILPEDIPIEDGEILLEDLRENFLDGQGGIIGNIVLSPLEGDSDWESWDSEEKEEQGTKPSIGFINGHEYVDLGLSVKWATHNIGAEYPSDYGDYIAWGEIQPKLEYISRNSVTYCRIIKNIEGNPAYDVARANWGGTWRLPTKEEIEELTLCKRRWITERGHEGYEIIGPNGNSIFLPAGGWRHKTILRKAGEEASYWSGTHRKFFLFSFTLYFGRKFFRRDYNLRYDGGLIRPVSE